MSADHHHYKLTHFDVRGVVEPIRLMFAYAGVEYEDLRIERKDWPAMQNSTPFHSLPVLVVDGEVIGQSKAIARFVAKRFNLAGKGDLEEARVDALADYVDDARAGIRLWMTSSNENKDEEERKKYFSDVLPEYLGVFEEHLKKNNGGHGFFVGKDVTWADFCVANFMYSGLCMSPHMLDRYPLLKDHTDRVHNLENIIDWIAERPNTPI